MKLEDLQAYIKKNISYDGNIVQSKITCQNCDHVVQNEIMNYWLDHKDSFSGNLATFLGLQSFRTRQIVVEVVDEFDPTGDSNIDSGRLAHTILEELG